MRKFIKLKKEYKEYTTDPQYGTIPCAKMGKLQYVTLLVDDITRLPRAHIYILFIYFISTPHTSTSHEVHGRRARFTRERNDSSRRKQVEPHTK